MINATSVGALADGLATAWAPFPRDRFTAAALSGLAGLELKDRVRHVSGALNDALTLPFADAAAALRESAAGLDMWSGWPATDYVATHGLDHLPAAMSTLAALTPHATAEFAVRPYLERYEHEALSIMYGWASSDDEHLRRLASEGSRPRLPWASRVRWLMAPGPTYPILERLRDDPSAYVRRSVANHVNDLTKDHPDEALGLLARWQGEGGSHVESVLRHAVRGLLRSGHTDALSLVGATPGSGAVDSLELSTDEVPIGAHLPFTVTITASTAGPLVLRYAVVRDGSRRVFHLAERTATPEVRTFTITKRHSFRPVTTRVEPPGPRTLEIIVNGHPRAAAPFTLTPP